MNWIEIDESATLKSRIRRGEAVVGCFQRIPAPGITEVCAAAGFDFVVFDMEHTPVSIDRIAELVRAAEAVGIGAVVRVASSDPAGIAQTLETGCVGIQVPLVRSAPEAEAIVSSVRFQPRGRRGLAAPRQTGFGTRMPIAEWVATSEARTVVIVQIEDRAGVACADEIAAVDGVDALFVGLTDLSQDLGVLGRADAPEVQEAIARVAASANGSGKAHGLPASDAGTAVRYLEAGARLLTFDDVRIMLTGSQERIRAVRNRS